MESAFWLVCFEKLGGIYIEFMQIGVLFKEGAGTFYSAETLVDIGKEDKNDGFCRKI